MAEPRRGRGRAAARAGASPPASVRRPTACAARRPPSSSRPAPCRSRTRPRFTRESIRAGGSVSISLTRTAASVLRTARAASVLEKRECRMVPTTLMVVVAAGEEQRHLGQRGVPPLFDAVRVQVVPVAGGERDGRLKPRRDRGRQLALNLRLARATARPAPRPAPPGCCGRAPSGTGRRADRIPGSASPTRRGSRPVRGTGPVGGGGRRTARGGCPPRTAPTSPRGRG